MYPSKQSREAHYTKCTTEAVDVVNGFVTVPFDTNSMSGNTLKVLIVEDNLVNQSRHSALPKMMLGSC